VRTPDGEVLPAVRCVKFANLLERPDSCGVSFVWYGEGVGRRGSYRHFGEAFQLAAASPPAEVRGHAAGLAGNGEQISEYMGFLRFDVDAPNGGMPRRIRVQGDCQEEWTLEPDGVVEDYESRLDPIRSGGKWFHEFLVRGADPFPGQGIRLMLSSGSWLGAGHWFDERYLHLGTFIGDPTEPGCPVSFGAADICHQPGYCGSVGWDHLLVGQAPRLAPGCYRAAGAWGEEWVVLHSATGWTLPKELAALTIRGKL
jgi:hypothetical protein